jgi:hypothetical protein
MRSLFPVSDSIVAPETLAERVRAEYGLEGDIDMRLYQTGFNDTYVARMGDGTIH